MLPSGTSSLLDREGGGSAVAVGAIASRYQARRRNAGRRLSGGRKALVRNLFDRA